MEVHLEGLTVRAPRWVTIRDIEIALVERAHWIVKSLAEWRARRVGIDYHVDIDRHYYSVPYRFANEELSVRIAKARDCVRKRSA